MRKKLRSALFAVAALTAVSVAGPVHGEPTAEVTWKSRTTITVPEGRTVYPWLRFHVESDLGEPGAADRFSGTVRVYDEETGHSLLDVTIADALTNQNFTFRSAPVSGPGDYVVKIRGKISEDAGRKLASANATFDLKVRWR